MKLLRRYRPEGWDTSRLEHDERIVSWAVSAEAGLVVATTHALWWPDADTGHEADEPMTARSVPWHVIAKATWRDPWLAVTEVDVVDDLWLIDRVPVQVQLAEPRDLPATVKTRVERSVVRSETATVDGGIVRFVARKVAGQDGLHWWARLEGGAVRTPEIEAAVAARMARLRA